MIPLLSGMLSSLVMGGIRGLLGGGQPGAGGPGIPTSITGMPMGRAPVLSSFPRYADGGMPISMMSDRELYAETPAVNRQPSLADYISIMAQGSAAPIDDGFGKGEQATAYGRLGTNIPFGDGQLRAGVTGNASYYNVDTPVGKFKGFEPQFSGADIGYSSDGRDYGVSYSQSPTMSGDVDRSVMFNYSMPFADGGGIMGLPPIPPGETPQMAYAMDRGGMIRGPGGGVDDLIGGSIDNRNKVLLSDGEFVVPARVVSALGDGSSEAGAKVLHGMIDRVKDQAEDRLKDNGNINLKKVLPA